MAARTYYHRPGRRNGAECSWKGSSEGSVALRLYKAGGFLSVEPPSKLPTTVGFWPDNAEATFL
ncbi:hypothetical protein PG990_007474 [Apiospora arundinis]